MTKTAEEIYEERLQTAVHTLVVDFFEEGIDYLTVTETLDDEDEDFLLDAYNSANGEIEDTLQRWLDRDN